MVVDIVIYSKKIHNQQYLPMKKRCKYVLHSALLIYMSSDFIVLWNLHLTWLQISHRISNASAYWVWGCCCGCVCVCGWGWGGVIRVWLANWSAAKISKPVSVQESSVQFFTGVIQLVDTYLSMGTLIEIAEFRVKHFGRWESYLEVFFFVTSCFWGCFFFIVIGIFLHILRHIDL